MEAAGVITVRVRLALARQGAAVVRPRAPSQATLFRPLRFPSLTHTRGRVRHASFQIRERKDSHNDGTRVWHQNLNRHFDLQNFRTKIPDLFEFTSQQSPDT